MTKDATSKVVSAFNRAISANDIAAMSALMSDDHALIDSHERRMEGRARCLDQWQRVFADSPGYAQTIDSLVVRDQQVYLTGKVFDVRDFGRAGHVLWRALCRDGQVAEWQVYRSGGQSPVLDN